MRWRKVLLLGICGSALLTGLLSCSPLPGRTVDPMAQALRGQRGSLGLAGEVWIGQYRDSRGRATFTAWLRHTPRELRGTWQTQAGETGDFTGVLASDGHTLVFTWQSSAPSCPVALAGRGTYQQGQIKGTYTGSDCEGAITAGRLTLRKKHQSPRP